MKTLKFFFIMAAISLGTFYVTIVLIDGTFVISEMDKEHRGIVFGLWLAVVVITMMAYGMDETTKNK